MIWLWKRERDALNHVDVKFILTNVLNLLSSLQDLASCLCFDVISTPLSLWWWSENDIIESFSEEKDNEEKVVQAKHRWTFVGRKKMNKLKYLLKPCVFRAWQREKDVKNTSKKAI